MQTSTPAIARRLTDFLLAGIGHIELANTGNQRLATKGLSMPTDFIASPLHCLVRAAAATPVAYRFFAAGAFSGC
jgi:hypothetical protein